MLESDQLGDDQRDLYRLSANRNFHHHRESGTTGSRPREDSSAMQFHDAAADGQAQAGSGIGRIGMT